VPEIPTVLSRRSADWNRLVRRLVAEVRKHDKTRPLIIEHITNLFRRAPYLSLGRRKVFCSADDPYIILSPHV
jgi:hypothetical protein